MAKKMKITPESSDKTLDETQPFYLAQFEETGNLLLRDGLAKSISLHGEILVIGRLDQGNLIIERLGRIALQSEPLIEELGGRIALAGPINPVKFSTRSRGTKKFKVRLYYPHLSKLDPACRENDAVYPQLRMLEGKLIWKIGNNSNDPAPRLNVSLELSKPQKSLDMEIQGFTHTGQPLGASQNLGHETAEVLKTSAVYLKSGADPQPFAALTKSLKLGENEVQSFTFQSTGLPFYSLEYRVYPLSPANSLRPCQVSPLPPQSGNNHPLYELHLRFYAVGNNITNNDTLEKAVQSWIDCAGEVWCHKGGIKIIPWPDIDSLATMPSVYPNSWDSQPIEVFLTKGVLDIRTTGGGETINCGTANAYIRLDVDAAIQNPYLLAHELGHVLGIYHPGACKPCATYKQGSFNSIMEPSELGQANSKRNTANNLSALEVTFAHPDQYPVYSAIKVTGCCAWDYDEEDIPLIKWVWNSDVDLDQFFKDKEPNTQKYTDQKFVFQDNQLNIDKVTNPQRGSVPNFMYVHLLDCTFDTKPVKIYFYLAAEQAPHMNLRPLGDTPGPHLEFKLEGTHTEQIRPKTRNVPWTVPNGYPEHCRVYAIAVGKDGPSSDIQAIINNPAVVKFDDPRLQNINIVHRDLTIPFPT